MSSGADAEHRVCEHLQQQGWRIVANNWTNGKAELDIVAEHNQTIRFIEVKYRRSQDFGGGYGAITRAKQQQLIRGARWWLQAHDRSDEPWQIDVANVSGPIDNCTIELVENAVTADS